jgi:hypothetical protein
MTPTETFGPSRPWHGVANCISSASVYTERPGTFFLLRRPREDAVGCRSSLPPLCSEHRYLPAFRCASGVNLILRN